MFARTANKKLLDILSDSLSCMVLGREDFFYDHVCVNFAGNYLKCCGQKFSNIYLEICVFYVYRWVYQSYVETLILTLVFARDEV